MLNSEETFKKYGYYPDNLSYGCKKPILLNCNYCNDIIISCKNSISNRHRLSNNKRNLYKDTCCIKCLKRGLRGKYNYNKDVFETIDSEQKAYWLGFIAADGHVNNKQCKICLCEKDIDHLIKFKECFNIPSKISLVQRKARLHNECVIRIHSSNILAQLSKYGITQQKSLTLNPRLNDIPENLHRHFWRGMFDGDGGISVNKSTGQMVLSLCGSYDAIYQFQNFIKDQLLIDKVIIKDGSVYKICLHSKKAVSVARLLYDNSTIYMQRKYDLSQLLILKYGK